LSPPPKFGNDCQLCNTFLDNFLIFKLRSTTEQMPALVLHWLHIGRKKNLCVL
jgi:hypothetical protein